MTEAYELQEYQHKGLVNVEDYAMSADALVKQVGLIQDVMSRVMKDGEHYGVIPGTKKPTLLKPGAEKLCLLFRFNPDYEIIMQDREEFFISYTVKCTLTHIPTGNIMASGVGSCNSKETKYRYRYIEESTGRPVPKEYWNAKRAGESKEMKRLLGGDGFRAAKIDDAWVIATSQKIENDNPYDLDNTLLKMACKRSLTAATLNATAASDIFTQDTEDMDPAVLGAQNGKQTRKTDPPKSTVKKKDPPKNEKKGGNGELINNAQKRGISQLIEKLEMPDEIVNVEISKIINREIGGMDELTHDEALLVIQGLISQSPQEQETFE